jgi:hypothetical protein
MSAVLLSWMLVWSTPPGGASLPADGHSLSGSGAVSGPVPLDLKPLREPLDRAAATLERALHRLESLPAELRGGVHLGSIVLAVLVTILLMTVIHQHGLAASKENRRS